MVIHYKCPHCGADMTWDSVHGMLSCESCGHQMRAEDYQTTFRQPDTSSKEDSVGDLQEYHCQNCGAVLLTDRETAATTCSFCGAGVVLADRLSGAEAPVLVLPFSISKEQAMAAFKKWCRNGLLTPKGFMTANRVKNITGIYVPFWLYDIGGIAEADATATRVRTYTRGEYIYTETSYYHVYRRMRIQYEKIPADASEKMNDAMMDKLEPYQYHDLKRFSMPYLAGFLAERNSYSAEEVFDRARRRAAAYMEQQLRDSISGYSTVTYNTKQTNPACQKAYYTLLPVWMVCYDYKQSEHTFAMNGQTGKIVGTPPLSKGKIAAWFAGISGGLFAAMQLVTFLLGGGFL